MLLRHLPQPDESFFLFGLRGSGKSTWTRAAFAQSQSAQWFDLLDESLFHQYLTEPRRFRESLNALKPGTWVVIDEVQRLPNLLNEVHSAIESKALKFALLGSSARKLRRAGVNLLGGRALQLEMLPLLPSEIGAAFSLDETLRVGSLALIHSSAQKERRLRAYTTTYLREEIQAEALVRNLPGFSRFLSVAALFHAQVLNAQTLARDAGVARSTIDGFLDILEDTLLARRLRAFEGKLRVKEKRHPKLYWADPGLARAARNRFVPVQDLERGALFEGLVFSWLIGYRSVGIIDFDDVYYWAVGGTEKVEVDFVLACGDEFIAIEVKCSDRIRDDALVGIRKFAEMKNVRRKIVIYTGDAVRKTDDGIDILPVGAFLRQVLENSLSGG